MNTCDCDKETVAYMLQKIAYLHTEEGAEKISENVMKHNQLYKKLAKKTA